MGFQLFGKGVQDFILWLAQRIADDGWPGIISLMFCAALVVLIWRTVTLTRHRVGILLRAAKLITETGNEAGLQRAQLDDIQAKLKAGKGRDHRNLAHAVKEYQETLLEPALPGEASLRNSVRPAAFLNLEDLHFGLSGLRMVPGLFVSAGLLCTFLGLIAALAATQLSLDVGGGDQKQIIEALKHLLGVASAKFTMSLTGLFCSIVFTLVMRSCVTALERAVGRLVFEFERRIDFVSLEGLADQQLAAIKAQTAQQERLNLHLIAELSKPLERMAQTGTEAVGGMVSELGKNLTSSVGQSLERIAERIDGAAESVGKLTQSLDEAAARFREVLDRSVAGLEGVTQKIEAVSKELTASAESVASTATPVMETARASADTARTIADSSIKMVDAAKAVVDAERVVVVSSAKSIEDLMRAFEGRAKAYDGQLDKAFSTYIEQVQRTLSELRNHSDGVHDRYGEALQILQAVIENARAFTPESGPTATAGDPS